MGNHDDQRDCLQCKRPIYGRIDKKYCSDWCRNMYNNRVNSDATNLVRNVNNRLRRNRKILLEFNPFGKTKIRKADLLKAGFDFDFFTNTYVTRAGQEYRYCYEQGYLLLNDEVVLLVVKNEG